MQFPDTIIYDGDEVLFVACKAAETEVEFDGEVTLHSSVSTVHRIIEWRLKRAKEVMGAREVHIAFSDPHENYRNVVLPSYKQHRKSTGKPVGYWQAKAWVEETWVSMEYPSLEADDVMGIHADDYLGIASSDKDLITVPGTHWSPYKDNRNGSAPVLRITDAQANWNFLFQTLTGDPVDGFKGCPKVGKVGAARILLAESGTTGEIPWSRMRHAWAAVEEAYTRAGKTKRDAIVQARCARILRPGEWDVMTGPKLFEASWG